MRAKFIYILRQSTFILLTLPASIAISIATLPILTFSIDKWVTEGFLSPSVFQFTSSSAQTILSTIATGSMTALSLAYSLALLVFTLAAGNIGPRLLKRFTTDPVNQITAGFLGGTFLYSLHALLYIQEDFLPKITIAGAGLLAIISVLQLIYFVRRVAHNITIDDEIAEITSGLIADLEKKIEEDCSISVDQHPKDEEFSFPLKAGTTGYLNDYNTKKIIKIASKNNVFIKLIVPKGKFVLTDDVIIKSTASLDNKSEKSLHNTVTINQTRTNNNLIEFSIRLLVEIALRALSPGINDTYTAIAVVDSLSRVISIIDDDLNENVVNSDENGQVRLISVHRNSKEIIGIIFHPLRRASTDNILMAQSLAKAYSRLYIDGGETVKDIMKIHAKLLLQEIKNGNHIDNDIDSVAEYLIKELKIA